MSITSANVSMTPRLLIDRNPDGQAFAGILTFRCVLARGRQESNIPSTAAAAYERIDHDGVRVGYGPDDIE